MSTAPLSQTRPLPRSGIADSRIWLASGSAMLIALYYAVGIGAGRNGPRVGLGLRNGGIELTQTCWLSWMAAFMGPCC